MENKVLVVDDEEGIRNVLSRWLSSAGYEVFTADSGATALDRFRSEKPSLVLLDIRMPGESGLDVLSQMRREDPSASVIMLTAVDDNVVGREALSRGAWEYVTKPVELRKLGFAIELNRLIRRAG